MNQPLLPYNMALRSSRVSDKDELDFFPTPPWATRALIEDVLAPAGVYVGDRTCWEPACGEGHMARPLAEYFGFVRATDIANYCEVFPLQDGCFDFLAPAEWPVSARYSLPGFIVTNPPFADRVCDFVEVAIAAKPTVGIAMFLRLTFVETLGRYSRIFSTNKPSLIGYFADRVPLIEGAYDPEASTATAYAWFVWLAADRFNGRAEGVWIPPGADRRHMRLQDLEHAKRGEAARRKAAREAASNDMLSEDAS